ncbi:GNAT family N-acetyltransferase [Rhizobium sp.]|uniref:GNAT family N-acetyltransferase n=1 Tax=Rhizobium sp. TaxID=391 RepID=UPI002AA7B753
MDLSRNVRIRPLQEDDASEVVRLYDAASHRDAGMGPISHTQWTSFIGRPHNHGGRDFRIAVRDDKIVGLAESSLRDQNGQRVRFFKLLVEPSMRCQRIGTALIAELLSLDTLADDLSFQALVANQWTDGIAFLEAFGFCHIESELSMRCSTLVRLQQTLDVGIVVEQTLTPAVYAENVARIHNTAFATDVAFRAYSSDEMAKILDEDEQELWIIRDAAAVLGYCRLEREPGQTWLEEIAIDPAYHGRGLGRLLVYQALQRMEIDREHPVCLNVSSINRSALSLYQRLGFVISNEKLRYSARQVDLKERVQTKS